MAPRQKAGNTHTVPPTQSPQDDPVAVAHFARLVRDDMYPVYLCGCGNNGILADVPLAAFRKYVDDYVRDATGSDCKNQPVLRSLIEQLLLLHSTIGRLHGDAVTATEIEHRRVNLQLAAQLTGELRRLAEEIERLIQARRMERLPFPAARAGKNGGGKKRTG